MLFRPARLTLMRVVEAVAAASILLAPGVASATSGDEPAAATTPDRARAALNRRVFDAVWNEVRRDYFDPGLKGVDWRQARAELRPRALAATSERELYTVINDLLDRLDDDHASAHAPAVVRRQDSLRQRRAVIGIRMSEGDDGRYRIESVRPGSAAEAAGIPTGWTLESVNGQPWGPEVDVIDGHPLQVRLMDQTGSPRDVTVVPRDMDPQPPFTADRSRPGVLVLRIEGFEPGLGRWMGEQLRGIPPETDVVLDLRANPGGLLMEADAALSCFMPANHEWARRIGRSGRAIALRIKPACGDLDQPIANDVAVLVDDLSRSAAELTPAALQESRRAIVVGEPTAGAVLIARDTRLPDGGRLTLSRADFVTTGGVRLEKRGVSPDLAITVTADTSGDPALDLAVRALSREAPIARALSVTTAAF